MTKLQANHRKRLAVEVGKRTYARIPVRTHVISKDDDIEETVLKYAGPVLREGDIMVVSEKIVAVTQGRAYPISQIKPSWLARFLAGFVYKSPYGIGLGSPWTMELAIRETGVFRIIAASITAGVAKLFGINGVFYRICGPGASAIDGPCDYTLPPYNRYAILGPLRPNEVAQSLSEVTGVPVAVVDANDLGVSVLGVSSGCPERKLIAEVLADNPLGQSCEQTPIGIIRPIRRVSVHTSASTMRRLPRGMRKC